MARMAAADCYQIFMAIKLHFESKSYNYFRYKGKIKTLSDFSTHKARFQFQKLCRMVDESEMIMFLVANFTMASDKLWVGDLLNQESLDRYMDFKKYIESMQYEYQQDLEKLLKLIDGKATDLFKINNGIYPIIVNEIIAGEISPITYVILEDILGFGEWLTKQINDDIIWPEINHRLRKLKDFITFDKPSMKTITKKILLNNS